MIRTVLVIAAVALGLGAAMAQNTDIISQRQALMKRSGGEARTASQILRGDIPYDQAKVDAVFAAFADKAAKLPNLFPDDSKEGETKAAPAIWEKRDDFLKVVEGFAADIKKAQETAKDLDSFKAVFGSVARHCGGCHEQFRRS